MPRKMSVKRAAQQFVENVEKIDPFLTAAKDSLTKQQVSWTHEYAVLKIYREFESLVLDALVGAINNDTKTISATTGVNFPAHLTDEVCEYLVVGDGYFDFRGRPGLIAVLKRFVPDSHYLVKVIKKPDYKDAIERLVALRNYAAHGSAISKKRAKDTLGLQKIGSPGSWLKSGYRYRNLKNKLVSLAKEIETNAPY